MIAYGRQSINSDDINAVVRALESCWLTTGPMVEEFETAVAKYVGASHGVAVNSGTAGLHAALAAIGIANGDEVIVPAMTFVATANSVLYRNANPIFADIFSDSLLIDPSDVERKITSRTKAIIAVDFAGQACDYDALKQIAKKNSLVLIADACHALGAEYKNEKVGNLADMTVFSFHPVKHITTGEGGMVVTGNQLWDQRMRMFRNHGIASDHRQREKLQTWSYEMLELGFNYRITDFQCALGTSQLKRLPNWLVRRRNIANMYNKSFQGRRDLTPISQGNIDRHAFHLYVIRVKKNHARVDRNLAFKLLRNLGIGVNVHYSPVYTHPYYRNLYGSMNFGCPNTDEVAQEILTLPLHHGMTDEEVAKVIAAVENVFAS